MTESEWLSCQDPQTMLLFLRNSGKASERKLRLFGCACYRQIWPLVPDSRSRKAVEVSERYADGLANKQELAAARNGAQAAPKAVAWTAARVDARLAAEGSADDAGRILAGAAMQAATEAGSEATARVTGWAEAHQMQAALLRDLFGPLPFRDVGMASALLRWNDSMVVRMATTIYENRHFPDGTLDHARLAVLADALEEAGCHDQDILRHCRQPGQLHVRGCWIIDWMLGKP